MKSDPSNDVASSNRSLCLAKNGELVGLGETNDADDFLRAAHREFRRRIWRTDFPCVGAKAAFRERTYAFAAYGELATAESTARLRRDLLKFRERERETNHQYATFISVFRRPRDLDEEHFEELLWRQLRQLHEVDAGKWAEDVSADPTDPYFSFSFAGRAFYIVGMHANSSRLARRFPWPTLVFNPHEQFERLRLEGKWKRMQQTIRDREIALQGNINPMLNDFGERSEARQYSGRAVGDDWMAPFPVAGKCPFAH